MSPRALAATLPKVTKQVLKKHGGAYAAIIAEWNSIVGPALADVSLPEKLTAAGSAHGAAGSLTVRVAGAAATEFQHMAPQIIERINIFLGFPAVTRLKLVQGPLPGRQQPRRPPPRPVPAAVRADIEAQTAGIEDPALRNALTRLGEAIAGRSNLQPEPAKPGKRR
jgi:hypothetical protein